MQVRLRDVAYGEAFVFADLNHVFEHRGNGWHQLYGKTETGGPWHADPEQLVTVERYDGPIHPSQTLSCFI